MEIKGKVHCFFEQSGTFKNEFIKLGIPAEDYDIQNNFGETDHTDDLFAAIETAYEGGASLFDNITKDDLIMAFFPCIYFCENNQLYFTGKHHNLATMSAKGKADTIIERSRNRQYLYELCLKMFATCDQRGLRLIVENPYATQHYLVENFPYKATIIDRNRALRGDYFNKPTQFFFVNCEPTNGLTMQSAKEHKHIRNSKSGIKAGICSEDRSMISPDYARNFICDFVLGKIQRYTIPDIFSTQPNMI
jgi:hypothetical protein